MGVNLEKENTAFADKSQSRTEKESSKSINENNYLEVTLTKSVTESTEHRYNV